MLHRRRIVILMITVFAVIIFRPNNLLGQTFTFPSFEFNGWTFAGFWGESLDSTETGTIPADSSQEFRALGLSKKFGSKFLFQTTWVKVLNLELAVPKKIRISVRSDDVHGAENSYLYLGLQDTQNSYFYIGNGERISSEWMNIEWEINSSLLNVKKIYLAFKFEARDSVIPVGGSFFVKNMSAVYEDSTVITIETFGGGNPSGGVSDNKEIPSGLSLFQNYPNPFNPSTKIRFSVDKRQHLNLKIFSLLGEEVETLLSEEKEAGIYEVDFNASNLPSGIYFYRLQGGSHVETKKMFLIK